LRGVHSLTDPRSNPIPGKHRRIITGSTAAQLLLSNTFSLFKYSSALLPRAEKGAEEWWRGTVLYCKLSRNLFASKSNQRRAAQRLGFGFIRASFLDPSPSLQRDDMEKTDKPSYRLRRTHNKSRQGCLSCKKRRIKCDELKPKW
jgi:hypothetical protein